MSEILPEERLASDDNAPTQTLADKAMAVRSIISLPHINNGLVPVVVHRTAAIHNTARFGDNASPVGESSVIGEDVVVHGSVFAGVTLEKGVNVGIKARLGRHHSHAGYGRLVIGAATRIEAAVKILLPGEDEVTEIGKYVIIGKGAVMGLLDKRTTSQRARFSAITVGDHSVLAPHTQVAVGSSIGSHTKIGSRYIVDGRVPDSIRIKDNPSRTPVILNERWIRQNQSRVEY